MGFGLCAFGCAFLLLEEMGLNLIGYLLMGLGFLRVSRVLRGNCGRGYFAAAVLSFALVAAGTLDLYLFFTALGLPNPPEALVRVGMAYTALLFTAFSFAHCGETARIARLGGGRKLERRAKGTMYITAFYNALVLAATFIGANKTLAFAVIFGKYTVVIVNLLFLFSCYTTITTQES